MDFIGPFHKGIRYALSNFSFIAGSMDYNDDKKLAELNKDLKWIWKTILVHFEGEEKYIFPLIADEPIFKELEDDHNIFLPILDRIETLLESIINETNSEVKKEQGKEFNRQVNYLIADLFVHLMREEDEALRALFEVADEDIVMREGLKITSLIPPEVSLKFMEFLFPAMNYRECAYLLSSVKHNQSIETYNSYVQVAKKALPEEEWQKVQKQLNNN